MRIRGLGTVSRVATLARSRLFPAPLILGYHRIAESRWDPQGLCVSPDNFAEQLDVLMRKARPVALDELAVALRDGRSLGRRFIMTFDDGYRDFNCVALPMLERAGISATVFVVSGLLGRPFWWSRLKAMVECRDSVPDTMDFEYRGRRFAWRKDSNVLEERERLLHELERVFRAEEPEHHDELLDRLETRLGTIAAADALPRTMTADELAKVAGSELIEIGSHTETHTSLSLLDAAAQVRELGNSRATLMAISGKKVSSFSFPNGLVSELTSGIAASLGYEAGCCSREAHISKGTDPFMLPRVWPGDWDGDTFSRWLWRWM